MISFPTTPLGEVWSGEETDRQQHPHHHPLGGVGVWWGCGGEVKVPKIQVGKNSKSSQACRLKIQAGCRSVIGGAS
jgi:hypothetical protein